MRRGAAMALGLALAAGSVATARGQAFVDIPEAPQPQEIDPGFSYFAGEQFGYDDNLFRLPNGFLAATANLGAFSRSDHTNEVSAGLNERLVSDLQNFSLDLRINRDTYAQNTDLDNTSGNGSLVWNWGIASKWSGQLSADYSRAIINFATTRTFQRDLLDTTAFLASGRYQVGPTWALTAQIQNADTAHTLLASADQDSHVTSGAVGVQLATAAQDTVELQYRYARATFPDEATSPGSVDGDFHDSTELLLLQFLPSDKTVLSANGGYLRQTYADPALSPYSGEIWHLSFKWLPGEKTTVVLGAARDLSAYVSAASEYFIDEGESISVSWQPSPAFTVSLLGTWDRQVYLPGADQLAIGTGEAYLQRRDHIRDQRFALAYVPRDWLEVDLSFRLEERDSDDSAYTYDDRLTMAAVKITL
jgi:hypothetical protein